MLTAVLFAAALTGAPCTDIAGLTERWRPAVAALQANDTAGAKRGADLLLAECATLGPAVLLPARALRGELALGEKDYDGAIAALAPADRTSESPFALRASLGLLMAYQAKQDAAGYAREREALVQTIGRHLLGPRIKGRRLDAFDLPLGHVTAYEAAFDNGPFKRYMVLILTPKADFAPPQTVMLTTDPTADALVSAQPGGAGSKAYFIDGYECGRHVTLDLKPLPMPEYPAVKAKAEAFWRDQSAAVSSSTPPTGASACPMGKYVAPGFRD